MRLAWSCHRSMRRTRHALLMDNFRQATRDECTLTRAFSEKFVTVTLPCDEQAGRTAERPHEAPLVCAWAAQQKRTPFGGQGHRRENCGHSQSYVKIGGGRRLQPSAGLVRRPCVSSGFEVWRGPSFASGSTLQHVRFGSLADIREPIRDVRFTPRSRHAHRLHQCLLSARTGLGHKARRAA